MSVIDANVGYMDTTYDLRICVDCAMLHANADTSGVDDPSRLAEVLAGLEDYPFVIVGEHHGFSWSACDTCGSRLGGDRFTATLP